MRAQSYWLSIVVKHPILRCNIIVSAKKIKLDTMLVILEHIIKFISHYKKSYAITQKDSLTCPYSSSPGNFPLKKPLAPAYQQLNHHSSHHLLSLVNPTVNILVL